MDALEKYVHDFSEPEEELLHELDRETNLRAVAPRMISGHIQGRLLEMLVRMLRPRRALEIGPALVEDIPYPFCTKASHFE